MAPVFDIDDEKADGQDDPQGGHNTKSRVNGDVDTIGDYSCDGPVPRRTVPDPKDLSTSLQVEGPGHATVFADALLSNPLRSIISCKRIKWAYHRHWSTVLAQPRRCGQTIKSHHKSSQVIINFFLFYDGIKDSIQYLLVALRDSTNNFFWPLCYWLGWRPMPLGLSSQRRS